MENKFNSQYEAPVMTQPQLTTTRNQVLCASGEGGMEVQVSLQSMGQWQ